MAHPRDVHGLVVLEPSDPAWQEGLRYAYETEGGLVWVGYAEDANMTPYVGEWLLPEAFLVFFELRELPYAVRLNFRLRDGTPHCTELRLMSERRTVGFLGQFRFTEPSEITSDGLRKLPVGRLQRLGVLAAVHSSDGRPHMFDDWADLYAGDWDKAPKRRPGEQVDDAVYQKVAETYRRALSTGGPTAAVQKEFYVSRSTAGRWVMEARRRGHLGPTSPGRMAK